MGPLRASARGEKSVLFFGAFFQVSQSQFRSLADRWCFSAIGHVGSASREGSAGAYIILCTHTMLWTENAPGKERLTICPASSKNGPRDLGSNLSRCLVRRGAGLVSKPRPCGCGPALKFPPHSSSKLAEELQKGKKHQKDDRSVGQTAGHRSDIEGDECHTS